MFRHSIRVKQTNRTCWTIQTHSEELNRARRRTFHEPKSGSLVRLEKRSAFGLGLSYFLLLKYLILFSKNSRPQVSDLIAGQGYSDQIRYCDVIVFENFFLHSSTCLGGASLFTCAFQKNVKSWSSKPTNAAVKHLSEPRRKKNFTLSSSKGHGLWVWLVNVNPFCLFCVSRFDACHRKPHLKLAFNRQNLCVKVR